MTESNESEFMVTFPVFLIRSGDGGLMPIQGDRELYIPMFTDEDSAKTFMERKGVAKYSMARFADAGSLRDYLFGVPDKGLKVAIDPLATDQKTSPTLIVLADLLTQL